MHGIEKSSKNSLLSFPVKVVLTALIWLFSAITLTPSALADTENTAYPAETIVSTTPPAAIKSTEQPQDSEDDLPPSVETIEKYANASALNTNQGGEAACICITSLAVTSLAKS